MPQTLEGQAIRLRAILESAIDAIITINADGLIETVNPAAEILFQYPREEFIGRNVHFLMPEPYHSEHDGYLRNYRTTGTKRIIGIGRQVIGRRADGTTFPMHLSVSEFHVDGVPHFTGVIHDISVQVEAEQALRHSQKMEAMGQLTGGIAHDFNNLLTVIIGNLELLEEKLTETDTARAAARGARGGGLGSRLTSRLLAFARRSLLGAAKSSTSTCWLPISPTCCTAPWGRRFALSTALTPDLASTRVDPAQVESAIINLAVNARDAMPNGGRLILETRNTIIDESYAAAEPGLAPGEYVQLSVSDTGTGMPAAVRDRAFEPFFTTKEKGRGTGLGLSMVYGFAKQSGGHATIYSEEGVGTTVNVYLPRHVTKVSAGPVVVEESPLPAQGETILVVEDDDRVRRLTVTRLEQLGYAVLEASSALQAIAMLHSTGKVDLVFTDLVMPGGMTGYELAGEVRRLYPGAKILLTSGYAEELANSERVDIVRLKILRKPYRQSELARAIDEALRAE